MRAVLRVALVKMLLAAAVATGAAQDDEESLEDYSCNFCHGNDGTLAGVEENKHLIVTHEDLKADVHWQKGLRCHDCHGGNPKLDDYVDHRDDAGFRPLQSLADMPGFCGHCHSDTQYMRRFRPSPRTDQEMEYWTSGHGQRLRQAGEDYKKALEAAKDGEEAPVFEDPKVATCLDCHSPGGKHNMLAVADQKSPVYVTHVAETCAKCHSDAELMADRTYHGKPLGHDQYEEWKQSVHGQAMLEKGDLSAPTCNDCHGNHGAVPPEVDSVANACGTCHNKVATLFAETRMKHRFEEEGLPGCAACHGNHQTQHPSDAMLGMDGEAFCNRCHKDNQFGATLAGATAAVKMRDGLENLKTQIAVAEHTIEEAERLGMEVRGPRFDLRQARDALTNARSVIHTFSPESVQEAIGEGLTATANVTASANAALAEHANRRIWLAATLAPILLVVGLLLLYIRALPIPAVQATSQAEQLPEH
ncbi:MAG: cytochrome c3 family protein [Planctomycetes bacterium]|nr:cytochrome c3 family protein [Planctomycetota bacterium]MBL7042451.1 cytochrome c3 family protein [Pirellulaceae bacterium]